MTLSRRRLLQGVGAGVAAGLLGTPGSAVTSETERVFVHPRNGLLGRVLDAVDDVGGEVVREFDTFDFVVAEVPGTALDALRGATGVAFVERDGETGIPSDWDPSLPDLFDPPDDPDCSAHPDQQPTWGHERIGADAAEPTGAGVDVGILDTGIESDHCGLSVADGRNFTTSGTPGDYEDRHGHGTHVAGIAGADDDGIGVVGVAPESNLYAVKVLGDDGSGRYSDLVAGIDWCVSNEVEVIAMSLGGEQESSTVADAVETATAEGHLLVSAAGNEGNQGSGSCDEETMTFPATHEDVLAVAAMDPDDTLASYSSVGSAIDLLAPGSGINSTYVDNDYAEASGTSMACPFVAGVAALVWETREEDGPGPTLEVREILGETAEPVLDSCAEGDGLVDAPAAVGDERATEGGAESGPSLGGGADELSGFFDWVADLIQGFFDWLAGLFR